MFRGNNALELPFQRHRDREAGSKQALQAAGISRAA
jgi:hypothetical protein